MKTTEKKRVLNMPSVRGELSITRKVMGKPRTYIYNFESLIDENKKQCCDAATMIVSRNGDQRFHIVCHNNYIELWLPGAAGGYLQQRLLYSEVSIMWASYKGIEQNQAA